MKLLVSTTLMLAFYCLGVCSAADVKSTQEELTDELKVAAEQIATRVRVHGEAAISVGTFAISKRFRAAMPEIVRQAMRDALNKYGTITVKSDTDLEVTAHIYPVVDMRSRKTYLTIKFCVTDCFAGKELGEEIQFVTQTPHLIGTIIGAAAFRIPTDNPARRGRELFRLVSMYSPTPNNLLPPVPIVGRTRISLGDYEMELLVNGEARTLRQEGRMAVALLNVGDEYSVRLINNTRSEAGVELLVDGLNMFHFSDLRQDGPISAPRNSHVLIAPSGEIIIPGWHRTHEESNAFLVKGFPESALGKAIAQGGLDPEKAEQAGTVTALFRRTWDPNAEIHPVSAPQIASGTGSAVRKPYEEMEREFDEVSAVLTIRYRKK